MVSGRGGWASAPGLARGAKMKTYADGILEGLTMAEEVIRAEERRCESATERVEAGSENWRKWMFSEGSLMRAETAVARERWNRFMV